MTMNANNQQPSFETHWVNTKTIAETITILDECKKVISMLHANSKGKHDLNWALTEAFYGVQDACIAMRKAQKANIIKSEED